MSDQNKTLVRRFFEECVNGKNVALMDRLVSSRFVNRDALPGMSADREGYKRQVTEFVTNFPDIHLAIEDVIAEGDKVVVRLTARGTRRGDLKDEPPAGRQATWAAILIFRVDGGKIVERWETRDDLGMMRQLGTLPAQEPKGGENV